MSIEAGRRGIWSKSGRGGVLVPSLLVVLLLEGLVIAGAFRVWWLLDAFIIVAPLLSMGVLWKPHGPELRGEYAYHLRA